MHRLALVILTAGITGSAVCADSIWERRDRRTSNLFQDNRARNVGDLLTIAINESTEANEREQRAMDKGSGSNVSLAGGSLDTKVGGSSSRQFSGSAQLSSDRRFLDRMTVTVIDVQPNGNLVVEGYRTRMVAGERRELRITGVVRPADIGAQNTVESRFVGNFRVSYLGTGHESKYVNPSWFSRVLNRLWPF